MDNRQSSEFPGEPEKQMATPIDIIKPPQSDVDLANVRSLMYALVTICLFCVSILFGPDEGVLPADGNLDIPIVDLKVSQGSFLYFGPIIIIFISLYTYMFVFRILINQKERQEYSDQYMFTMKNTTARLASHAIFFGLPTFVLFAFFYKAIPRPESTHLLGIALVFLISTITLQLMLYIQPKYVLIVIMASFGFVSVILSGFIGIGSGDNGWLASVRDAFHTWRPLTLVKVDLSNRDLRGVDMSNAKTEFIQLPGADLRGAMLNEAILTNANLKKADLRNAKLNCANLNKANLEEADLRSAVLGAIHLKEAKLPEANLVKADFYRSPKEDSCERTQQEIANLEEADLTGADLREVHLSQASLIGAKFGGEVNMYDAKIIDADFDDADLSDANLWKADLRCSIFTGADLSRANLESANLGGADFEDAILNNTILKNADIIPFNCSENCVRSCVECVQEKNTLNDEVEEENEDEIKKGGTACSDCTECGKNKENASPVNLRHAKLPFADLEESDLRGANLIGADLQGASLYKADLEGASLKNANLFLTNLMSVKGLTCEMLTRAKHWKTSIRDKGLGLCDQSILDFQDGIPVEIDREIFSKVFLPEDEDELGEVEEVEEDGTFLPSRMEGALMWGIQLADFDLHGVDLQFAKLDGANLDGANLREAQLQDASLQKADMWKAKLVEAELTNVDLRGANLNQADLTEAIFVEADLEGADLRGAMGLTCSQLKSAKNWRSAFRATELSCGGAIPTIPDEAGKQS